MTSSESSNQSASEASPRVAAVTGATRGIGLAIAEHLAREGWSVAVSSRSLEDAEAVAQTLVREHGITAAGFGCDVQDPKACGGFIAAVAERMGGLDALVNNAGVGSFAPIQELSVEDWQRQIDTNLGGVFYCSKAAVPHLKASGDGWIINIGSLASRNSFAGGVGYNASKFGLLGMSEAMMLDLRNDGIRVSLIMPGSVNTYFRDRTPEAETWRLESDDVARAVMDVLRYPDRALPSRIEMRPTRPPQR
jgi:3-oxoacyl-[acyl-carrier protein] reductase